MRTANPNAAVLDHYSFVSIDIAIEIKSKAYTRHMEDLQKVRIKSDNSFVKFYHKLQNSINILKGKIREMKTVGVSNSIMPQQKVFTIIEHLYSLCFYYKVPEFCVVVVPRNSAKFSMSVILLINLLGLLVFQAFRFIQISLKQQSLETFILDITWLSGFGILSSTYGHLILKRNEFAQLVNMFIIFEERFESMDFDILIH